MVRGRRNGGSTIRFIAATGGAVVLAQWLGEAFIASSRWTSLRTLGSREERSLLPVAASAETMAAAAYTSRALDIEMAAPPGGKLGVSVTSGTRTISSINHQEAHDAGWRVGDVVIKVGGQDIADNDALKQAAKG